MTRDELLEELRRRSRGRISDFRDDQWDAIDELVNRQRSLLLIQRTGWGKSLVYMGATIALRRAGAGPTLVISPLLSLMRDQVRAAQEDFGLNAVTINSGNASAWSAHEDELAAGSVDILIVSPERLGNDDFLQHKLRSVADGTGLFVVDEVHCISDWGHDFRPDYQRIRRILTETLPADVPTLMTTATANERVTEDIQRQLGGAITIRRGPLGRESLALQAISMPSRIERYAWLADQLPCIEGSGIVYTATIRDADRLAAWLRHKGLDVAAYHSEVRGREELERRLRDNRLKALVSTPALGMGFDKPDLAFVIHFQAPQSAIHYYQMVGRAGRRLDRALGILLSGDEDDDIVNFFIQSAWPTDAEVQAVLDELEDAAQGVSTRDLATALCLPESKVARILRWTAAMDGAPVHQRRNLWYRGTNPCRPDRQMMARLTAARRREWRRMQEYLRTDDCLMRFLARELDDHTARRCGRCANCLGLPLLPRRARRASSRDAALYLKRGGPGRDVADRRWWSFLRRWITKARSGWPFC